MNRQSTASAAVLVALALGACGSSGSGAFTAPPVLRTAPEPASAPPPAITPAGTVIDLKVDDPEGVVVAPDGTIAVAARKPDALLLLDAATLATPANGSPRTISVRGAARHLELGTGRTGGSAVLVPGEDTDVVSTVALPSGSILSEVKVGRQPHDVTQIAGTVVVADELGNAVTAIDTSTSTTLTLPGPVQPGGVASSGGLAAVVAVRGRLLEIYRPAPLTLIARIPVGAGPTHAVDLGGGMVAVADTTGGQIFVVRLTGKAKVVSVLPLPGRPYGLGVDPARHLLYVATSSDNTLHAFTFDGARLTAGKTYPTVRQPNSLAVAPGTHEIIVVGSTPDGQLQAIDP